MDSNLVQPINNVKEQDMATRKLAAKKVSKVSRGAGPSDEVLRAKFGVPQKVHATTTTPRLGISAEVCVPTSLGPMGFKFAAGWDHDR